MNKCDVILLLLLLLPNGRQMIAHIQSTSYNSEGKGVKLKRKL